MAEGLRRWTRNPMVFPRVISNPACSEETTSEGEDSFSWKTQLTVSREQVVFVSGNKTLLLPAAMAEWLTRWTRNPMGFPRAGSNPACSEETTSECEVSFSWKSQLTVSREQVVSVSGNKTLVLPAAMAAWLRRWTPNPTGFPRACWNPACSEGTAFSMWSQHSIKLKNKT